MAETLFGGEKSGTPVETRKASADLAKMFQEMMRGGVGGGGASGRMSSDAWTNMLGFDPRMILGDAATSALRDPADATRGLFSSMEPFERRETAEQVGGLRDMFGTMGGRFSRNVGEAEGVARGEIANQFSRTRQQGLLEAAGLRNNALAQILGAGNQAASQEAQMLQIISQFLQPGAPVYTEGIVPGLIGAGGNLAGLYLMGGGA